jgi:hypothetical protein
MAASTINSNVASVALTYTLAESVTITATAAGGQVVFDSTTGIGNPITITETASLGPGHSSLFAVLYFSSSNALIGTATSATIPTSAVSAAITGGTGITGNCTHSIGSWSNACGNGSTNTIYQNNSPATGQTVATQTAVLTLSPSSATTPDTYNGTINVVAMAN